jgi:hypothetical protein
VALQFLPNAPFASIALYIGANTMNYFQLDFAPEELGFVPQDNGTIDKYERDHPNSVRRAPFRRPIGNLLLPEGIKFRAQSKFTDMLCLIPVHFPFLVVSDRFLEIIVRFRLPEPEVFRPLSVYKRTKKVDYNIIIAILRFPEYVVFNHTEVIKKEHFTDKVESLYLNSPEEYRSLEAGIDYSKEYLTMYNFQLNTAAIQHDMFLLPRACGVPNYIVSEAFVAAVREAKLTGIAFRPI